MAYAGPRIGRNPLPKPPGAKPRKWSKAEEAQRAEFAREARKGC